MMVGEGALGHLELAQQHGTCGAEALDHGGIDLGHPVGQDGRAAGGADALGEAQVLHRDRHAVQRAAIASPDDLVLGLPRLIER
jgi:hypothetical protein